MVVAAAAAAAAGVVVVVIKEVEVVVVMAGVVEVVVILTLEQGLPGHGLVKQQGVNPRRGAGTSQKNVLILNCFLTKFKKSGSTRLRKLKIDPWSVSVACLRPLIDYTSASRDALMHVGGQPEARRRC